MAMMTLAVTPRAARRVSRASRWASVLANKGDPPPISRYNGRTSGVRLLAMKAARGRRSHRGNGSTSSKRLRKKGSMSSRVFGPAQLEQKRHRPGAAASGRSGYIGLRCWPWCIPSYRGCTHLAMGARPRLPPPWSAWLASAVRCGQQSHKGGNQGPVRCDYIWRPAIGRVFLCQPSSRADTPPRTTAFKAT